VRGSTNDFVYYRITSMLVSIWFLGCYYPKLQHYSRWEFTFLWG